MIAARVWKLGDEPLGPELGEIVAERAKLIAIGRAFECLDDVGVDFSGGEGIASGDVREAHEGMHESELPRVIEPQSRNALSRRPVGDLKVPSVRFAVADRGHDPRWFARLEDDHHCIGARPFEIWIDEVIAAASRILEVAAIIPVRGVAFLMIIRCKPLHCGISFTFGPLFGCKL